MVVYAGGGRGGSAVKKMLDAQEARFEERNGRQSCFVQWIVHFGRHVVV
jgi:hypothetical protein